MLDSISRIASNFGGGTLEVLAFIKANPGIFVLTLASDPGFVMILGPMIFSFIWSYLKTSATARGVPHASDLVNNDYIVNLAVHVASLVFGGLLYIFINIEIYRNLKSANAWSGPFEIVFATTALVLIIGIWRRGFINGGVLERYHLIPLDQIAAPWDLRFTWFRFVCALLSWVTTVIHMMYKAPKGV